MTSRIVADPLRIALSMLSTWTVGKPAYMYAQLCHPKSVPSRTHDTRCYFNVRSKADTSQLNLPTEPTTEKWNTENLKSKNGYAQKYQ